MRSIVERYGLWSAPRDPKTLFSGLAGGGAIGLAANALGRSGAPTPKLTPPPAMPDPLSPDALEAKRKTLAASGSQGRSSTQLTSASSDTLAGSYASTKLGASS